MREAQFLKQNAEKWKQYELEFNNAAISADKLAEYFVELTDDLSFARTFYPKSNTTGYLNGLAGRFHQKIYTNRKEKKERIFSFWQYELPFLFKKYQKQFLYAFLFFLLFLLIGILSARYDHTFSRLILGDSYVNMTQQNIAKGDPFGVYKSSSQSNMFFEIAFNNIRVAFITYVLGIFFSIGPLWILFNNGIMLGTFEYFLFSNHVGYKSITIVFIHGTLEIWSFVIAGAAGLILGNSLLFPGTYSRQVSFLRGGKDGLKIVVGLVPLFLTAAFLESFVTRYADMPLWVSLLIMGSSLAFIIWYFMIYPILLSRKIEASRDLNRKTTAQKNKNFYQWLNNRFS